ncbi:hypothetical protein [Kitasatospora sp. NPDC001683]
MTASFEDPGFDPVAIILASDGGPASIELQAAEARLDKAYTAYADGYNEPPHVRRALDAEVRAAITHLTEVKRSNSQS